ncbi:MAG TPA: response regulator [Phycisphaerae bacterium]|nr:response regulator [Phycisphaerae bacterium]
MRDAGKTKRQLIEELQRIRDRISALESQGRAGRPAAPPDGDPRRLATEIAHRNRLEQRVAERTAALRGSEEEYRALFDRGHAGRDVREVPPVVLLDLKLPKVDGLEVLRRMRADARTKPVPVVVLTSSDEERDLIESYKLGANSHVRKPVDFGQFSEAVGQLGLYWLLLNQCPPAGR